MRYFDLYHGMELTPERDGSRRFFAFNIEAHGYGALLAIKGAPDAEHAELMAKMKQMTASRCRATRMSGSRCRRQIVDIHRQSAPAQATPGDMVKIPAGDFHFQGAGDRDRRLQ